MTPIARAARFYSEHGLNFARDLEFYMKFGCLVSLPDRFIMAREIKRDAGLSTFIARGEGDAWFVQYAAGFGCLRWFVENAPRRLPWLAWHRSKSKEDQRLRFVDTGRFLELI